MTVVALVVLAGGVVLVIIDLQKYAGYQAKQPVNAMGAWAGGRASLGMAWRAGGYIMNLKRKRDGASHSFRNDTQKAASNIYAPNRCDP